MSLGVNRSSFSDDSITFQDIGNFFYKWKYLFLVAVAVCTLMGVLYGILNPRYVTQFRLETQAETSDYVKSSPEMNTLLASTLSKRRIAREFVAEFIQSLERQIASTESPPTIRTSATKTKSFLTQIFGEGTNLEQGLTNYVNNQMVESLLSPVGSFQQNARLNLVIRSQNPNSWSLKITLPERSLAPAVSLALADALNRIIPIHNSRQEDLRLKGALLQVESAKKALQRAHEAYLEIKPAYAKNYMNQITELEQIESQIEKIEKRNQVKPPTRFQASVGLGAKDVQYTFNLSKEGEQFFQQIEFLWMENIAKRVQHLSLIGQLPLADKEEILQRTSDIITKMAALRGEHDAPIRSLLGVQDALTKALEKASEPPDRSTFALPKVSLDMEGIMASLTFGIFDRQALGLLRMAAVGGSIGLFIALIFGLGWTVFRKGNLT